MLNKWHQYEPRGFKIGYREGMDGKRAMMKAFIIFFFPCRSCHHRSLLSYLKNCINKAFDEIDRRGSGVKDYPRKLKLK